jgi:WD40 repeat protein
MSCADHSLRGFRRLAAAAVLAVTLVVALGGGAHGQAYREVVDPQTGIRVSLPPDLLARETRTRWGTNWSTADGSINFDTLAYPDTPGLRRLYDNLKSVRGRRVDRDQWSEQGFVLAGHDRDGSGFQVEMRKQGTKLRGYSLVYGTRGTETARRLIEHLGQHFEPFPATAGLDGEPGADRPVEDARASEPADPQASPITVQPNLGDIDTKGGIQFAPDGKYLAIGNSSQIKLWQIASGRPLRVLEQTAYFEAFTFIDEGARILSLHKDGEVRIWNPLTGRLLSSAKINGMEPGDHIGAMSHDASHRVVAMALPGGRIQLWNYQRMELEREFAFYTSKEKENARLDTVSFSRDGRTLLAGDDATVKRFDVTTSRELATVVLRNGLHVVRTIGDDLVVAKTANQDCDAEVVLVMLAAGGPRYATLERAPGCKHKPDTSSEDDRPSDDDIVVVHNEHKGLLYVARRGGQSSKVIDLAALRPDLDLPLTEVAGAIEAVDASATLAAFADGNGLRIARLTYGSLVGRLRGQALSGFFPIASADGSEIMLHHTDAGVEKFSVWPINGVAPTFHSVRLPEGFLIRHAVPDANLVLGGDDKGRFVVYSILTGERVANFQVPGVQEVNLGRLSPDGRYAMLDVQLQGNGAGSSDSPPTAYLIETRPGTILYQFRKRKDGDYVRSFAFSADGQRLALGLQNGTAEIWNVKPPAPIKHLAAAEDQTTSLRFSPDNRFLIGGSRDAGIFVWSVDSGKLLRTLERAGVAGHVSTGGLAISDDSQLVATGPMQRATSSGDVGRERRVQVWDMATGRQRFLLSGHEENVNALLFTKDGRWIVSGSNDGTIRYWDRRTGSLGATYAAARSGHWVMVTGRGFFAASADAGDLLSVVRGYEATSIEQMWQSLYAPDLVREHLAGDPTGEVKVAAAHADLQKVLDSRPTPEVTIVRPAPASTSASDLIDIEARITDMGKGVGRVEWRVNGITAAVANASAGDGPNLLLSRQVALDPGDNAVEVVAYNGSNLLASLPARATIRFVGAANSAKPTLHVLSIGINAYVDQGWRPEGSAETMAFPPLNLAASDAKAFAAALKKAGEGQYAEVTVTEAIDGEATAGGLQQIVERMASQVAPRDTFVLFAAAHGTSHEGRFYLIPQDFDGGTNPAALQARAIGQDRLQDWVANRIKAKRTILLLDTCESGALVGGYTRSRTDVPASEAAIGRLHEATGRPVLTAAAEGKPAFEGYEGHGVFTWALLDALKNGDRNGNGTIELSELVARVQEMVPTVASRLNGRGRAAIAVRGSSDDDRQSARFGSRGEDFTLVRRLQ